MSRLNHAIYEVQEMDELAERNILVNHIHPLAKLIVTVTYIICIISFDRYNLFGLLPMIIYPIIMFYLTEIPISKGIKKLRVVLPVVCFIGILNPFFDHTQVNIIGDIYFNGGVISMITLIIKGFFTLFASFLFIASTGIERICYALKLLHVPSLIVTQILLLYRYITVLMSEANAVYEAYSLRAPRAKGVKYKVWGSLLGQLLYRSLDRAERLYDSMVLRGFKGEFYYASRQKITGQDCVYLLLWAVIIIGIKLFGVNFI